MPNGLFFSGRPSPPLRQASVPPAHPCEVVAFLASLPLCLHASCFDALLHHSTLIFRRSLQIAWPLNPVRATTGRCHDAPPTRLPRRLIQRPSPAPYSQNGTAPPPSVQRPAPLRVLR